MIDDYAPYEPVRTCEPYYTLEDVRRHRPGVADFWTTVLDTHGGSSLGVGRDCGRGADSKHHESRAWDWSPPSKAAADDLVAQLVATDAEGNEHALARRYGVRAIIWYRQIWTAHTKQWRPYTGASAHTDHVHVDFSWDGAMGRTSAYQPQAPDPDPYEGSAASRLLPFCPGSSGGSGSGVAGITEPEEVSFFRWETQPNGLVVVDQGAGASAISLAPGPLAELADGVAVQWGALAADKARKYDVPLHWVLGFILQESGGDPAAVSPAGAIGLMQIVPRFHPTMRREQLFDPEQNVDYGTSLLRDSRALGYDLPAAASRYNAGAEADGDPHPSTSSPWGMREQSGYISGVVRGSNYFHGGKAAPAGPGLLGRIGPLSLFLAAGAFWYFRDLER